jgi:hypothetical protein
MRTVKLAIRWYCVREKSDDRSSTLVSNSQLGQGSAASAVKAGLTTKDKGGGCIIVYTVRYLSLQVLAINPVTA